MYQTLLTELNDGIFTITINRPDKLNALNKQVFDDLDQAMDHVYANAEIRAVIITGAGSKSFVAGADIAEFSSFNNEQAFQLSRRGQLVFDKIENAPKPVVAAINGFALGGGCELAMACHFRLCSDNAKFGQPEVNLGLIPGYGGTQRLTKIVGKGKSMELQMSAQMIDAEEAYRLRLVNHVTTAENLLPKTREILQTIHSKAPIAISKIIHCINLSETAEDGFVKEAEAFGQCFDTADMREGTTAFLEKRKAIFQGK